MSDALLSPGLTPKTLQIVQQAIGDVASSWSFLEFSLDCVVALTYHKGGGTAVSKKLLIPLGSKIEFLRECFEKLGDLSNYKHRALSLLERVDRLTDTRHQIIHGYISEYLVDKKANRLH